MSACAKRPFGTRAHKAKLYKIEDKVAKINQAIHDVLLGLHLHIALVQGSTPHRLRVRASGIGHFGLIFDQNLPFFEKRVLVRIELRGAIVELARKSKMS